MFFLVQSAVFVCFVLVEIFLMPIFAKYFELL